MPPRCLALGDVNWTQKRDPTMTRMSQRDGIGPRASKSTEMRIWRRVPSETPPPNGKQVSFDWDLSSLSRSPEFSALQNFEGVLWLCVASAV